MGAAWETLKSGTPKYLQLGCLVFSVTLIACLGHPGALGAQQPPASSCETLKLVQGGAPEKVDFARWQEWREALRSLPWLLCWAALLCLGRGHR